MTVNAKDTNLMPRRAQITWPMLENVKKTEQKQAEEAFNDLYPISEPIYCDVNSEIVIIWINNKCFPSLVVYQSGIPCCFSE